MKKILYSIALFFLLSPIIVLSQSTILTRGGKEESLLNRIDIITGNKELSFSSNKPYYRKEMVKVVEYCDSLYATKSKLVKAFSETDKYNMQRFLMANSDYSKPREAYKSETPLYKIFYTNRANMIEKKEKDFLFIINPVFNYQMGNKADVSKSTFINQRGISLRGIIDNKIGFYFYFTENQERQPQYLQDWRNKFVAYPTAGYVKNFKVDGVDFFDSRGGINWSVGKRMTMELACDKNFIGNGYRSLLLSDFGMNYMFLKTKYNFGKLRYENIYAELVSNRTRTGGDYVYPRKYYRASYLSLRATKNINIGVFEGVMFGKSDGIGLAVFNPIMFTNFSGDKSDKSYGGFDVKMNILKKFQLYAQGMIDGITFDEKLANNWWGNRFAYQVGAKYINAFEIKNLDAQVEANVARPFMYASDNDVTTYTHYNQPLAHPLGANFNEYIAILKYQPIKKLYLETKAIIYSQGKDTSFIVAGNRNFGSNIFANVQTRPYDYGWTVTNGNVATCTLIQLLVSYEIKENLFADFSFLSRNVKLQSNSASTNSSVVSVGLRWNIGRKEYLF